VFLSRFERSNAVERFELSETVARDLFIFAYSRARKGQNVSWLRRASGDNDDDHAFRRFQRISFRFLNLLTIGTT